MKGRNLLAGLAPALVILLLLVALPQPVNAQGGEGEDTPPGGAVREVTDDEVNAVSRQLYCPVCENIPLEVCGTAACARWREQVRTLLSEGKSEDEVIDYFVTQFGERVVGTPQDPVLNFFSWAVPAAAVILGLVIVGVVFVKWRSGGMTVPDTPEDAPVPPDDDDYRIRLEQELRNLE